MMLHDSNKLRGLRLYQIDFFRTPFDVAHDYNNMTQEDKDKLSSFDIYASFDYEDEFNNYIILFLTTQPIIDKYKIMLFNNVIPNITKDISQNVISYNIDLSENLEKHRTKKNSKKLTEFQNNLDIWIESNLDLDKVLDMINEKGMECLKKAHLNFLKKI